MREGSGWRPFETIVVAALAVAVLLSGCAVGSSQAACATEAPEIEVTPQRVAPGQPFTLRGENFIGRFVCDDTGPDVPERDGTQAFPSRDVRLEFRQGEKTWKLETVDAGRSLGFETRVEVPEDARPGRATVRAVGGGVPASTTFWAIDEPAVALSGPKPSRATLSYGERTRAGGPGSHCWSNGCADTMGFAVPQGEGALAATTGSGMVFGFGGQASSVEAEAVSLDAEDVRLIPGPGGIRLLVPEGNRIQSEARDLEVRRAPGRMLIEAGLPPRKYALGVFVGVPNGDVSYYFRLRIEPEVGRKATEGGICGTL